MKKITLTFAALAAFTMAPVSFAHIDGALYEHVWSGDSQDNPLTAGDLWSNGVVPGEGLAAGDPNTQDDILHSRNAQLVIPADNSWSVDWINLGYVRADENDTGSARIIQNGSNVYADGYVRIGQNAGSLGIWEINGGSLTLRGKDTGGPLKVGFNGTGVLKINGGEINVGYGTNGWEPAMTVGDAYPGYGITSLNGQTGTVTQKAGKVNAGRIFVGYNGGTGEWNISGGGISTSSWLAVAAYGGATGTMRISGDARVAVGWDWLDYGVNFVRHHDLKNPADYPDSVNKNGSWTIPPNGSTNNGTLAIIGGWVRAGENYQYLTDAGNKWNPDGLVEVSGNGQFLIQGDLNVGYGARRTKDANAAATATGSSATGGACGTISLSGNAYMPILNDFYLGRKAGHGTLNIAGNARIIVANNFVGGASVPSNRKPDISDDGDQRDGTFAATGIIDQSGGHFEVRGEFKLVESTQDETYPAKGTYDFSGGEMFFGSMPVEGGGIHDEDKKTVGYFFLGLYGDAEMNISGTAHLASHRSATEWTPGSVTDTYGVVIGSGHGTGGSKRQGTAVVNQTGGHVDLTNVASSLGRNGGIGTWNMKGGVADFRELFLGFHKRDAVDGAFANSLQVDAIATLNLIGGVLSAKFISQYTANNATATGVINFAGGTLKAREDTPEIFITDQVDEIKVSADSYIDTSGRNFEIAAKLTGTGNLIILGGGDVTFTGDKIGFTGDIIIGGEPPNPTGNFNSWAKDEFSDEELADSAISGPEADPQNIGVPNLLRYALGLSRNESPVGALPTLTKNDTAGFGALSDGNSYTFSYRYDATKEDITYIVETSTDLKNWETVDTEPTIDEANGTASVVISADGAVRKFFRLKIVQK